MGAHVAHITIRVVSYPCTPPFRGKKQIVNSKPCIDQRQNLFYDRYMSKYDLILVLQERYIVICLLFSNPLVLFIYEVQ